MKLPRNIDADRLISAFQRVGYRVERQRGSHIVLAHRGDNPHEIVVPNHRPIRPGTLNRLLKDTADHASASENGLPKPHCRRSRLYFP